MRPLDRPELREHVWDKFVSEDAHAVHEPWADHAEKFRPGSVAHRWLTGESEVHIRIRFGDPLEGPQHCAVIETLWTGEPCPRAIWFAHPGDTRRSKKAHVEASVSVDAGKFIEPTEGSIPAVIRLVPLDDCDCVWMHPTQPPRGHGHEVGVGRGVLVGHADQRVLNVPFGLVTRRSGVRPMQGEGHVVKGRVQVREKVTQDERDLWRWLLDLSESEDLGAAIGVHLSVDGIEIATDRPSDQRHQILQVVFCSHDLLLDRFDLPRKIMGGHGQGN